MMNSLFLENLRCFSEPTWIRLAPLTILIGENSTGKSTVLAAQRLAWDLAYSAREPDFNEDPFLLGAYDQIAHYHGGPSGRAKEFQIGLLASTMRNRKIEFQSYFKKHGSQPAIAKQVLKSEYGNIEFCKGAESNRPYFTLDLNNEEKISIPLEDIPIADASFLSWDILIYIMMHVAQVQKIKKVSQGAINEKLVDIQHMLNSSKALFGARPYAFAPVRTQPQRTYDPVRETPDPEGMHVPMLLARTYFTNKKEWSNLKSSLDKFGQSSGLFNSLEIKTLGNSDSDPFQLRVKIHGPPSNLIDVGYGVSQVLPILVHALTAGGPQSILVQQPEVHLHPRAQAELGRFFGTLAKESNNRFVIETHSDYLIDRIRMDVRDKKTISNNDIAIFYFERVRGHVRVHEMGLDSAGNLIRVPVGYRQFFLDEERRFLGIE